MWARDTERVSREVAAKFVRALQDGLNNYKEMRSVVRSLKQGDSQPGFLIEYTQGQLSKCNALVTEIQLAIYAAESWADVPYRLRRFFEMTCSAVPVMHVFRQDEMRALRSAAMDAEFFEEIDAHWIVEAKKRALQELAAEAHERERVAPSFAAPQQPRTGLAVSTRRYLGGITDVNQMFSVLARSGYPSFFKHVIEETMTMPVAFSVDDASAAVPWSGNYDVRDLMKELNARFSDRLMGLKDSSEHAAWKTAMAVYWEPRPLSADIQRILASTPGLRPWLASRKRRFVQGVSDGANHELDELSLCTGRGSHTFGLDPIYPEHERRRAALQVLWHRLGKEGQLPDGDKLCRQFGRWRRRLLKVVREYLRELGASDAR